MASNIAHELRNPLTIMGMYTELLEKDLEKTHKRDLEVIRSQVRLCDKRINELLTFCKPMQEAELIEIPIKEFLEELLRDLGKANMFSNIKVIREFDENPLYVLATGEQLRHIFINLIENAAYAMKTGGRLTIKTENSLGFVQIGVTDFGQGISSEAKDHIFEPFYTTKEAGTGLGLAIAQKTVFDLNGTIEVESNEGEGTTFRVGLPVIQRATKKGWARVVRG